MQPRDDDPTATKRIFCDREKKAHRGLEDDGGRRERGRLARRRAEPRDTLVSDGAKLLDGGAAERAEAEVVVVADELVRRRTRVFAVATWRRRRCRGEVEEPVAALS
jgi:hypothetical protein